MWATPPISLNELPQQPGVYRMLDGKRKILYVGKARNLRKRISSYFRQKPDSLRTEAMVMQVRDIEFSMTASEAEALILEHNLIKQLKPRYNVLLKDSRSYPYLLLTDEAYPRLKLYRGNRSEAGEYFGPFPDAGAVRRTLHIMQKAFMLRDCENSVFNNRSRPCMQHQIGRCTAPCCDFVSKKEYALQVAEARRFLRGKDAGLLKSWERSMVRASEAMAYEEAARFRDRIRALRTVLANRDSSKLPENGDAVALVRSTTSVIACVGVRRNGRNLGTHNIRVDQAVEAEDFEVLQSLLVERYRSEAPPAEIVMHVSAAEGSELQRLLRLLHGGSGSSIRIPRRGARVSWLEEVKRAGEESMASRSGIDQQAAFEALATLFELEETPRCIAAVDNAHLGGKQTVAAITYANWSGADREHYRKYRLDEVPAGDDYEAMRQVLSRFFSAINEDAIPCPDLMLIDGGRGQLSVAMDTADEFGLSELKLVAVAKGKSRKLGDEVLWPSWHGSSRQIGHPCTPGKYAPALLLIARVRDEAHRFAGQYMRKRKKQSMFSSRLDTVPGIGKARRTALLKHFGGIDGIKKAGREQLAQAPGISDKLADTIFTALHR
ncbi:MAG: excinuclease ABC subunit UvrC [Mariprofundaceae bacterium]|nr:excinuclease ABC subunit UvrC [Mariprofundaceae bacterium]